MGATGTQDAPAHPSDGRATTKLRLRVDVYDPLAGAKGHPSVASQAEWHGLSRATLFRLRAGGPPGLDTALRIAEDLGVDLPVVWEQVTS
jgi:DNA-binding phage protein